MQEHTGYFLQSFGKLPLGDSSILYSEILGSSNPTKLIFVWTNYNRTLMIISQLGKIYLGQ